MNKSILIGFSLLTSPLCMAKAVQEICPKSVTLTDQQTVEDFLETLTLQCDQASLKDADAITLSAIQILKERITSKISGTADISAQRTVMQLPSMLGKETKAELEELAKLLALARYGASSPREAKIQKMGNSFEVLQKKVASLGAGPVTDQKIIGELKQLQTTYLEDTRAVMLLTETGKKTLDCYNNISPEYASKVEGGKLPTPRIAEVEALIGSEKIDPNAAGQFGLNDSLEPGKKKASLMLELGSSPQTAVLSMVHEMAHGCNGLQHIGVTDQCKEAKSSLQLPGFKDFLNERTKNMSEAQKALLPKFTNPLDFKMLQQTLQKLENPPEKNAGMVPPKASLSTQKSQNRKLESEAIEALARLLSSTAEDKKQVEGFIKLAEQEGAKSDSLSAYFTALNEARSFRAETDFFKEIADLDPVFCASPRTSFNYYAVPAFTSGDFYRTLDEGNTMDEVLKAYSLRNKGIINPKFIFEGIDAPKSKSSSTDYVSRDGNKNYVYKKDFLDYLKNLGYQTDL